MSALLIHTRSLSLRGNATQDSILYELARLKRSIEQSLQVALCHNDGFSHTLGDPFDTRVAENLRNLARAAQNFHSSASSTASSIHDANKISDWKVQSDAAMSVRGTLTPNKREQIHQYLDQTQLETTRKPLQHSPNSIAPSVEPLSKDAVDENDDLNDEVEFESLFLSGLEEVSKQSMLKQDFKKAETFLEKAIQIHIGLASEDSDFKHLQISLIICYFFQHKWRLAEPLITGIAKSRANLDAVVCNLLHALALAYLSDYRFDDAIKVCRQALRGKKKMKETFGASYESDYNETLGLLATIHDIKGDLLYPEVLRRTIPQDFTYCHPFNEVEFIGKHSIIFQDIFGGDTPPNWGQAQAWGQQPIIAELPGVNIVTPIEEKAEVSPSNPRENTKPETLHIQLDLYEKFEADTSKEVIISIPSSASDSDETGGGISSSANSDISSRATSRLGLVPKRSFTRSITRLLGSVRSRSTVSSEDLTVPQSPELEYISSLPRRLSRRQRLRRSLWPNSDSNMFSLKKSGTKLQKRARIRPVQKPSAPCGYHQEPPLGLLLTEPINWSNNKTDEDITQRELRGQRQDIYSWFGLNSEDKCPDYCDDSFEVNRNTRWDTASRILGANPIGNMDPHHDGSFDNNWGTHWDTASRILGADPVGHIELPDNAVYASRSLEIPRNFEMVKNKYYRNATISGFTGQGIPNPALENQLRRPKLTIIIPNSSKNPGWVPLDAHFPRHSPQSLIDKVNSVNDSQSYTLIPHPPPSPPLSINEGNLCEIFANEIRCPLGSKQKGIRISEEYAEQQPTGPVLPGSPLESCIGSIKPKNPPEEILAPKLPPSPPASIVAEAGP